MGGYVGFVPFYWTTRPDDTRDGGVFMASDTGSDRFDALVNGVIEKTCAKLAAPPG
jgi:hypothetical protein